MLSDTSETLKQLFKDRNKRSHNAFKKAQNILPGGSTREIIFHKPYPLYIRKGKGCWIQDIDGHRILDFLNNYTSLILGHAHPKIVEAIKSQIINGTSFSAPTEHEHLLAVLLYTSDAADERSSVDLGGRRIIKKKKKKKKIGSPRI